MITLLLTVVVQWICIYFFIKQNYSGGWLVMNGIVCITGETLYWVFNTP